MNWLSPLCEANKGEGERGERIPVITNQPTSQLAVKKYHFRKISIPNFNSYSSIYCPNRRRHSDRIWKWNEQKEVLIEDTQSIELTLMVKVMQGTVLSNNSLFSFRKVDVLCVPTQEEIAWQKTFFSIKYPHYPYYHFEACYIIQENMETNISFTCWLHLALFLLYSRLGISLHYRHGPNMSVLI